MLPSAPASRTARARTSILLTGFGPFPGVPVNATMRLVPELATAVGQAFPDVSCHHLLLETEWTTAPARVAEVMPLLAPDLVLHFGVSSRARGFEVETRARNACLASPDAAGFLPPSSVIAPDAQAFLPASLPARHVVSRLRARGIPAFVSRDAGTYLCNCVLFHSLAARGGAVAGRVGFIHVPATLARPGGSNRGRSGACALTWTQAVQGGLEIVSACLGRPGAGRQRA